MIDLIGNELDFGILGSHNLLEVLLNHIQLVFKKLKLWLALYLASCPKFFLHDEKSEMLICGIIHRNYLVNFWMSNSNIKSCTQLQFSLSIFNQRNDFQSVVSQHKSYVPLVGSQKEWVWWVFLNLILLFEISFGDKFGPLGLFIESKQQTMKTLSQNEDQVIIQILWISY